LDNYLKQGNKLLNDAAGATAVEYAILISLIAMVIFLSVALFGQQVLALFDTANKGSWYSLP
jgi:Flp pilus assembly pilin Flp